MTDFLAIAFTTHNGKLCAIATSEGVGIADRDGLSTRTALAFLWSLNHVRRKRTIVTYNSAIDVELLVKDLKKDQKDQFFDVEKEKRDERFLRNWRIANDLPVDDLPPVTSQAPAAVAGFRIWGLPGKILRVMQGKRGSLCIYDIESFFSLGDIADAVQVYLDEPMPPMQARNDLALWGEAQERILLDRCLLEAQYIKRLADRVAKVLEPLDLNLRQWYGPSAVAARCLTKWNARRQAKRLHDKNSASELLKAIDCALFGGRVEQIMIGTIANVNTFDLNSAYAYAVTLLSQFYKPLQFTRQYEEKAVSPFSVWLVDYELPVDTILGVLPTRSATGAISFRSQGKGYFWQPEVDYLSQRYPGSFEVRWGYTAPYQQVTFASEVHALYDYRMTLKAKGDAGESMVKLALVNLFGKFAQNTGKAHFQCRAWAGWITSLIRRLLLDAVTGVEDRVISFNQDAVHMADAHCPVEIGPGLGQWKATSYAQGFYVIPGIYAFQDAIGTLEKQATRGINLGLDWQQIATDLSERQVTELARSFFVGYRLARLQPVTYGSRYLEEVQESLSLVPARLRARNYLSQFNWREEAKTSTISTHFDGRLSRRYIPQETQGERLPVKEQVWR